MPTTDDYDRYDEQQNAYREDKEEYSPTLITILMLLAGICGGVAFWLVFIR